MANDRKVTGKKYRILTNKESRLWDIISFWTSSRDVEFDDGENLQTKMDGVVEELQSNTDELNEKLPFKLGYDEDGNYGYYKVGADTLTPFKSGGECIYIGGEGVYDLRDICSRYNIDPTKLTDDNFLCALSNVKIGVGTDMTTSANTAIGWQNWGQGQVNTYDGQASYDQSTATLTVTQTGKTTKSGVLWASVGSMGAGYGALQSDDGSRITIYAKGNASVKYTLRCFLLLDTVKN